MSIELIGIAVAALIAACGWWMRRARERRTLAYLLALDAKFVGQWLDAVAKGLAVPEFATLYVWRNNQAVVADLFPRWCSERLASLWWFMESQSKTADFNEMGMLSIQMEAKAVGAAFDWYAGTSIRVQRPKDLDDHISEWGAAVLVWRPPILHRLVRIV